MAGFEVEKFSLEDYLFKGIAIDDDFPITQLKKKKKK